MSNQEREGIYVYQPFGTVTDPARAMTGRLYGLGGLPFGVHCNGLTKDEADAFADALNSICWMMTDCPACGNHLRFESNACPNCRTPAPPPWKSKPGSPSRGG